MGVRRNLPALTLTTAGCTLLALAAIDWFDALRVILYHATER